MQSQNCELHGWIIMDNRYRIFFKEFLLYPMIRDSGDSISKVRCMNLKFPRFANVNSDKSWNNFRRKYPDPVLNNYEYSRT